MYLVFTTLQVLILKFYNFHIEKRLVYLLLSGVLIFLFYGFRIDVGEDWKHYKVFYEEGTVERFEFLFRSLMKILKSLFAPASIFFGIVGLLQFHVLQRSLPKATDIHVLFIIIFFLSPAFIASANGMRQFLATAFVVYGFNCQNVVRKSSLYLMAILTHASSPVLILVLHSFLLFTMSSRWMCVLLLVATLINVNFNNLVSVLDYLAILDNERINVVLMNLEYYNTGGISFGPRRFIYY